VVGIGVSFVRGGTKKICQVGSGLESVQYADRLRFMLLDVVEQRLRGCETRRTKEWPKKIEVGSLGAAVCPSWLAC
jgi:hypothetical protein